MRILQKYHTIFFFEIRKDEQSLSSAAVVIGASRVIFQFNLTYLSGEDVENEIS